MWNYADVKEYCKDSKDVEQVLAYIKPIPDTEDITASPQEFFSRGGGDCEDYANAVYHLLADRGYEVKMYRLEDDTNIAHRVCTYSKDNDNGIFSNSNRFSDVSISEYLFGTDWSLARALNEF